MYMYYNPHPCNDLYAEGGKKEVPSAPTDCHSFPTQAGGEEGQSHTRNIPMKEHEVNTVGPGVTHPPGPLKHNQSTDISREEQSNGNQTSRMVAPTAATSIPPDPPLNPAETPSPYNLKLMYNMLASYLDQSKIMATLLTNEIEEKKAIERRLTKKGEKVKVLKERKKTLEDHLQEKDKQHEVQEDLKEKEKKTKSLREQIDKTDCELEEVREDKKCYKVAELEKQLEAEKDAKEHIQKQLAAVIERNKELQRQVEDILKWTDGDLEEEEEGEKDIRELMDRLDHQRRSIKTYFRFAIFLLFLLVSRLLI